MAYRRKRSAGRRLPQQFSKELSEAELGNISGGLSVGGIPAMINIPQGIGPAEMPLSQATTTPTAQDYRHEERLGKDEFEKGSHVRMRHLTDVPSTPNSKSDFPSSPYSSGLMSIAAMLQDPGLGPAVAAINKQSGNTNMTLALQALLQNTLASLQKPSSDKAAQIQNQIAQIYKLLPATQGQAPSAASQQMEQVLGAMFASFAATGAPPTKR